MQRNLFENPEAPKNQSTAESLANEFGLKMQNSEIIYTMPNSRKRISFLIGVFLVEKNIIKRSELGSEKADRLIGEIYDFHMTKREQEKSSTSSDQSESKKSTSPQKNSKQIDPYALGMERKYKKMGLLD
jgi:hypothetical protein